MTQCAFPDCIKPQKAHGLCPGHNAQREAGKELTPLRGYIKQDPFLVEMRMRKCSGPCGTTKEIKDFYSNEWWCKNCSNARTVAYKQAHPEYNRERVRLYRKQNPAKVKETKRESDGRHPARTRARHLKELYDLTLEEADAMAIAQEHRCAVCGTDDPGSRGAHSTWTVDHDHITARVRGLLCARCNRALGLFKDDPGVLRAAADYIEHHNQLAAVEPPVT